MKVEVNSKAESSPVPTASPSQVRCSKRARTNQGQRDEALLFVLAMKRSRARAWPSGWRRFCCTRTLGVPPDAGKSPSREPGSRYIDSSSRLMGMNLMAPSSRIASSWRTCEPAISSNVFWPRPCGGRISCWPSSPPWSSYPRCPILGGLAPFTCHPSSP